LPAEGAKFDGGPKEFYIIAGRLYTASHGTLLYAVLRVKTARLWRSRNSASWASS